MSRILVLGAVALASFAAAFGLVRLWQRESAPAGMVRIPGGEFTMGTDSELGWADEKPAHRVRVNGFWMDRTEVTNRQFRAFVEETGYVTTAETWMPKKCCGIAARHALRRRITGPGSMVFADRRACGDQGPGVHDSGGR